MISGKVLRLMDLVGGLCSYLQQSQEDTQEAEPGEREAHMLEAGHVIQKRSTSQTLWLGFRGGVLREQRKKDSEAGQSHGLWAGPIVHRHDPNGTVWTPRAK